MPSAYATSEPAPEPRPGPTGTPLRLRPVDEVGDDQEVAGEAHLHDGLRSRTRAAPRTPAARRSRSAASGNSAARRCASPARASLLQMLVDRDARRRRELGQVVLAERDRQIAALRDRDAVRERLGKVGEPRRHLRLRQEMLLGGEGPRAARIGEHMALGDAHARLVRAEVVALQELDRMRRDDRQRRPRREPDGRRHERVVVGTAGALHLEVEAAGKELRPGFRAASRAPRGVALQQRLADVAVARAGQRDQAFGAVDANHRCRQLGATAMLIAAVGARQPVAQPQVAARLGAEEQRAKRRVALGLVREPDVAAGDRLHPCARAAL